MGFLDSGASLEELEEKKQRAITMTEIARQQAERKALIAEAKRRYGKDWMQFFKGSGKGGGSGIDWNAVKFKLGDRS